MHSGETLARDAAALADGKPVEALNAQDLVAVMAPSAVAHTNGNGNGARRPLVLDYGL